MNDLTAFVYHDAYLKYHFGYYHPFQPTRAKLTFELLKKLGVFGSKIKLYEAKLASIDELSLIHSIDYIMFVKDMCEAGFGFLDYGDTPVTKSLFEGACWRVGGSIKASELVMKGTVSHAFNPGGGFHHAKADSASGFCVFNDIAISAEYLKLKFNTKKILIIDIDAHHGDGTQDIFYFEPILKISLHRFDGVFYPGSGYIDELGAGEGYGYNINIPLPVGTDDEAYLYCLNEVVFPLIESYRPEIIIAQLGTDGHYLDNQFVGLALTTKSYINTAKAIHYFAHKFSNGRLIMLGGGGFNPQNVARCWALMFLTVAESNIKKGIYESLLDKEEIKKDEKVFRVVEKTVRDLKSIIFPIHGIK